MHQAIEIHRHSTYTRTGKVTAETQYGITSLPPWRAGAKRLMKLVRKHWNIENKNNHVRDDSWREDRQVYRRGNGAFTMGVLLSMALLLLRSRYQHWRPKEPLTARAEIMRDDTLTCCPIIRKVS